MANRLALFAASLVFLASAMANGLFVGLGHDEGVTVDVAVGRLTPGSQVCSPVTELYQHIDGSSARSAREVVGVLSNPLTNLTPPAYFLLMRGWTELVGVHRVSLRIPSLLFGLVTLLGLARLARRLVPRPGVEGWVMLLAALSPWFLSITTFARPYALALAVAVWSTVAALAVAEDMTRIRSRVLFVALSLLGLYTLYHYAFVLAWQLAFLAVMAWRAGAGRRAAGLIAVWLLGAAIAAGFSPWFPVLQGHLELSRSVPQYFQGAVAVRSADGLLQLPAMFLLGDGLAGGGRSLHLVLLALLGLMTAVMIFRNWRPRGQPVQDMGASTMWLMAPLYPVLILVADLLNGTRTLTITKTSFLIFPFLLLVVLRAWLGGSAPRVRTAGLVLWVTLLLSATWSSMENRSKWVYQHGAIAKSLAAFDDPRHLLVINSFIRGHAVPLLLTLRESGVRNVRIVHAPPSQLVEVLTRICADNDAVRITMVAMRTSYAWDSDSMRWSADQLDTALRLARRAGWMTRRLTPAKLQMRQEPVAARHRFELISRARSGA
jgi:uncharacterized membrane protein